MIIIYMLHLALVANIPAEVSVEMWKSAEDRGLDPYDLAATLISEKSSYDADFSITGSLLRSRTYDWEPTAEGSGGELGLFQTKARWARKAGYKPSERADALISTRIGAYVIEQAQKSHADCRAHNHHWIAHWKGGPRDAAYGQARFAQSKWSIIRQSLGRLLPVNVRTLHHKHFAAARKWASSRH